MAGRIQSLWRHPVKGFTPERVESATLTVGGFFPCDRIYAVEDGPSGFDPAAPRFISKQKFTVLAKIAAVARARTAYDEASGEILVRAEGRPDLAARLTDPAGREAFAGWLAAFLDGEASGPLKVVQAPGHRFTDHPQGHVSIINLASVRDLEARIGRPLDPLRFRGNLYVDGWPAWAENGWIGRTLSLGEAMAEVFKPIVRCVATHVDPATGERDIEVVKALHDNFGHLLCGIYVSVTGGGRIAAGDAAEPAA
ncbi:MOSC domain-containing protein [Phenylobacterium montanum]|uniref:MOSC domain-containing protein n=1 Tax=Phenylobacterium montanum TaxID=2823693 RepID=A0A975IU65_9CAUL|nr:MOSC N-terminal beta barrel domain-containing protein [Caulobacter sp. S6]QUD87435.1 MOSC domain-containing protein [Caulobacter sp. S6]